MNLRFELFSSNPKQSVAFYRDVLGFREEHSFGEYRPVKRDSVTIGIGPIGGLSRNHYFQPEIEVQRKGLGIETVLEVEDVQAEYERVQHSGYAIAEPLKQQEWGLTDFRLVDPDGHYLRITSKQQGN